MGSQALDHAARSMGFRDYATYQAYQAQQQMMREAPNRTAQGAAGQPGQVPAQPQPAANAPPQNWLQRLMWGLSGGHQ